MASNELVEYFTSDDVIAKNDKYALMLSVNLTDDLLYIYDLVANVISSHSEYILESIVEDVIAAIRNNSRQIFNLYKAYEEQSYHNTPSYGHCGYLAVHQLHQKKMMDTSQDMHFNGDELKALCIQSHRTTKRERASFNELLNRLEVVVRTSKDGGGGNTNNFLERLKTCAEHYNSDKKNPPASFPKTWNGKQLWFAASCVLSIPTSYADLNVFQDHSNKEIQARLPSYLKRDQNKWGTFMCSNLPMDSENYRTVGDLVQKDELTGNLISFSFAESIVKSTSFLLYEGDHFFALPTESAADEVSSLNMCLRSLLKKVIAKIYDSPCLIAQEMLKARNQKDKSLEKQPDEFINRIDEIPDSLSQVLSKVNSVLDAKNQQIKSLSTRIAELEEQVKFLKKNNSSSILSCLTE